MSGRTSESHKKVKCSKCEFVTKPNDKLTEHLSSYRSRERITNTETVTEKAENFSLDVNSNLKLSENDATKATMEAFAKTLNESITKAKNVMLGKVLIMIPKVMEPTRPAMVFSNMNLHIFKLFIQCRNGT